MHRKHTGAFVAQEARFPSELREGGRIDLGPGPHLIGQHVLAEGDGDLLERRVHSKVAALRDRLDGNRRQVGNGSAVLGENGRSEQYEQYEHGEGSAWWLHRLLL